MIHVSKEIASLNTGTKTVCKITDIEDILQLDELSQMFPRQEQVLENIKKSMETIGFDEAEPIVVWKKDGKIYCVDGNTRLQVAKELADEGNDNFFEIPVVEKNFSSLDEAIEYAKHRQFDRRNMTAAEIFAISGQKLDLEYGEGREVDVIAKEAGISPSTVKRARTIAKYGDEETIDAVKNNKISISAAAKKAEENMPKKNKKKESDEENLSDTLSDNSESPAPLAFNHSDGIERPSYTVHPEDDTDRWIKEKNIQVESAKKEGLEEGLKKGSDLAYEIYDYILSEIESGKSADDLRNNEKFADFSVVKIYKAFGISDGNKSANDEPLEKE